MLLVVKNQVDQTRHEQSLTQGRPNHTPNPDLDLKAASLEAIYFAQPGFNNMEMLRFVTRTYI